MQNKLVGLIKKQADCALWFDANSASGHAMADLHIRIEFAEYIMAMDQWHCTEKNHIIEGIHERTEHLDIFLFHPSLNGVLFLMFCLLVEGECQILVF